MNTNFRKVYDFNKCFGVPVSDTPEKNVFDEKPDLVKLRFSLIHEEVNELEDAIKTKNFTEVVDALSDILYVVYGAGVSFGIDLDKAFDIVHDSNMSKLCKTEDEARQTVEWYKTHDTPYDSPDYRKSDDGKYWVVYNHSTGKILKSINYIPANFSDLLN